MAKLLVRRKSYTRKDGTRVRATTYKVGDKGKRGLTPKSERWYTPKVHMGWRKDVPQAERIRKALSTHKGDLLATARSLQALSNVTADVETKRKAKRDASLLFTRYLSRKRGR